MSGRRGEAKTSQVILLSILASVVVLFDQISKYTVLAALSFGESTPVIPGIFHLTLVRNTGIAFGLFRHADQILNWLIPASILVLFYFAYKLCRDYPSHTNGPRPWTQRFKDLMLVHWGILLILGGAIGNWLDRMRYGAVIDFLDFRVWPVFNFADCAITIGVGLYILALFRHPKVQH